MGTFSYAKDGTSGHVGGAACTCEIKLVDCPEQEYFAKDPNPRGEICFKGYNVFPGYFKDTKRTEEALDKDGWLHTGDVGMILPNGALKIIDRKKNIFKLSQGEYVAPEKIENAILRTRLFDDAFIYGDSLKSYLVSVLIPNRDTLANFA